MECFYTRDRRNDAQHAIVLAGVAHGIEVRTRQYCRQAGPNTVIATNDIADGIESGLHAGLFHPAFDQLARGLVLRRQEMPGERPVVMRDGRELLKPGHDLRAKAQTPRLIFNLSHMCSLSVFREKVGIVPNANALGTTSAQIRFLLAGSLSMPRSGLDRSGH